MNRDDAIRRAREALAAWERWTISDRMVGANAMADALRDLLAVEAPALTEWERARVEQERDEYGCGDLPWYFHIIDRLCPPEPKHKPCECGRGEDGARIESDGNYRRVECACGRSGPWMNSEATAWVAWDWDRRSP